MTPAVATIRSASLNGYVELATLYGLDAVAMLRAQGLSPRMLAQPEAPISVAAARRLLEASARAAGVEHFGLRLAVRRRMSNLGPISIVLRAEPTARAALDTLCRYLKLLNASLITRIEEDGNLVVIREDLVVESGESVRQSMELAVGVMARILAELLGPTWRPRRVYFAHRAPRDLAEHHALFGPVVTFNAPFNGVVCAAGDLAAPLPPFDTGMAPFARAYLEQALSRQGGSAADSARALIAALLPGGRCTAEQTAQHLAIDRRTLHRRLAAEDTSFSGLLAEARRDFAVRQLRDSDRPLAELAELLGFSGASAFAFWFRRQFGCTVSQWRARPDRAAVRPRKPR